MRKKCPSAIHLFSFSRCSKDWTLGPRTLSPTSELFAKFVHHILLTPRGGRYSNTKSLLTSALNVMLRSLRAMLISLLLHTPETTRKLCSSSPFLRVFIQSLSNMRSWNIDSNTLHVRNSRDFLTCSVTQFTQFALRSFILSHINCTLISRNAP